MTGQKANTVKHFLIDRTDLAKDNKKRTFKKGAYKLENFSTKASKSVTHCQLCSINEHVMDQCAKYSSFESRQSRCQELNLCFLCASDNHKAGSCPGQKNWPPRACKFCSSRGHISPLCKKSSDNKGTSVATHVCTNTGIQEQLYILPIVVITVSRGKRKFRLNCLFDTGSQRTYFCRQVIKKIRVW